MGRKHLRSLLSLAGMWILYSVFCQLPQDPSTIPENSKVELSVDSLSADTNGIFRDTVGKTISFHVRRELSNLIDSFIVNLGDDTSMVFATTSFKKDTFGFSYSFGSVGRKPVSVIIYRINGTVYTMDSIIIIDIVNRRPSFIPGKPDTLYSIRDGDSLFIPLEASDSKDDRLIFRISEKNLPEYSDAAVKDDSVLFVKVPINCTGEYSVTVMVTDNIDSAIKIVKLSVTDKTPPNPPVFKTSPIASTSTPTWQWVSGGGGGAGVYRYVLDVNDFSGNRSVETDTSIFTSPSSLTEGVHTLFLQERDSSGNWSKTASWAIIIDLTAPTSPRVSGTTPTNNTRPTWTWNGSGLEGTVFRFKLDSDKFSSEDTVETAATSFTPESDLPEGNHTLYVQEKDAAGNWSASGSFSINIDITPPQPPTVSGVTPTSSLRPMWNWTPNGGGKGYFRCAIDSNVFTGNHTFTSGLTFIPSADLTEGNHTLYVQEQDSAGNWSKSGFFTTRIDITPPSPPVFTSKIYQNNLRPTWSWESGGGGSGNYRYRLDDDDLGPVSARPVTSFTSPANLTEGPHTLYLQEVDSTGNWSVMVSQVIVVDTTPPQPPKVMGDVLTNRSRPTWTWTSGRGGCGAYRLKINSNDMDNQPIYADTTSYTPESDLTEGNYRLYVQERDEAGNWSESDSFLTTIDLTPPRKPVVYGTSITNNRRPTWSWSPGGGGAGEYRYKLDSEDMSVGATVTTSTAFTPSDDLDTGGRTLYVQERDAAGNWSEADSFTTIIDVSAKGVPGVSAPSPTNNPRPTWSWTSGGGTGIFRYKLDDPDLNSGAVETSATSFTPESDLAEGTHILYVQEIDSAGNWSAAGISVVQIDLTPPSPPSITSIPLTNNLRPRWNWSSGTGGAGIFRYKLDSDDLETGAAETQNTSFTPESDLTPGSHTLYLQERDAAGNFSVVVSFTIIVDVTPPDPPVVSASSPTNDPTPLWTWISGGGGNGTFRYKLDGGDFSAASSEKQYVPPADLAEGEHTLYVQEADEAGNWSEAGRKSVVVDITAPNPPSVTGLTITNNTKPTWNWSSGGGGNGTYRYKLDNPDLSTGSVTTTSTSYTPSTGLSETSHTFYVQERDDAGNWSATGSFTTTIDTTRPGKPIFVSGTSMSPSGTKTLVWIWQSGGGGNGKFRYKLDLASWGSENADTTYMSPALSEGLHTFSIMERDDAGNWSDTAMSSIYVLPAPGNLKVASVIVDTGWAEELSWDDNSNSENKFYIYKEQTTCIIIKGIIRCWTLFVLTDSVGANIKTYRDFNVVSCSTYTYYVAAVRSDAGQTASETVSHTAVKPGTICIIPRDPIIPMDPVIPINPIVPAGLTKEE